MTTKKPTRLSDLVTVLNDTDYKLLSRAFMERVFFLPPEVLSDSEWNIEPLRVIDGAEWFKHKYMAEQQGAKIHYDPSEELCSIAKKLGVSVRKHWLTGETFIIVKLWYGKEK